MILSVPHSGKAAASAYTTRYIACPLLSDFEAAAEFLHQGDREAANQMVTQGKCIWLEPGVKVYVYRPEWAEYQAQIHLPGSTDTLWTHYYYLRWETNTPAVQSNPVTTREWFVLKSFLWIEPHRTTNQEIITKYGSPISQDEDWILYRADQSPDFKGWKMVKFLISASGVVEEIRAEK
jgi:hypothetical protein